MHFWAYLIHMLWFLLLNPRRIPKKKQPQSFHNNEVSVPFLTFMIEGVTAVAYLCLPRFSALSYTARYSDARFDLRLLLSLMKKNNFCTTPWRVNKQKTNTQPLSPTWKRIRQLRIVRKTSTISTRVWIPLGHPEQGQGGEDSAKVMNASLQSNLD